VRAHRVDAADDRDGEGTLRDPDYVSAFEVDRMPADERTPEQWARAAWEEAPGPLRRLLLAGWTVGLRLRLGPRPAPDHVLGWPIVASTPDVVVLQARSSLMICQNVVRLSGIQARWSTVVRYEKGGARVLWSLAAPVHHRTLPALLNRAARP
jgi:hypothetical protein